MNTLGHILQLELCFANGHDYFKQISNIYDTKYTIVAPL